MQVKFRLLRFKMALEGLYLLNSGELSLFYDVYYRKLYKYPEIFI